MREPKDDLHPLMARAEQLRRQVAQMTGEIKVANPKGSSGVGLAEASCLISAVTKRLATPAGKYLGWSGHEVGRQDVSFKGSTITARQAPS